MEAKSWIPDYSTWPVYEWIVIQIKGKGYLTTIPFDTADERDKALDEFKLRLNGDERFFEFRNVHYDRERIISFYTRRDRMT